VGTGVPTGGWGSLPTYKFRIGSRLLYVVQQVAEELGVPVSRLIRVAVVSYLEKLPLELLFAKTLRLGELFKQLRQYALTYRIATVNVTSEREILIRTLMSRIKEISTLCEKGKASNPRMMKQVQLLAYLCDVADGILENVATDELLRRIERCEELASVGEAKSEDREPAEETGEGTQTTRPEAAD